MLNWEYGLLDYFFLDKQVKMVNFELGNEM